MTSKRKRSDKEFSGKEREKAFEILVRFQAAMRSHKDPGVRAAAEAEFKRVASRWFDEHPECPETDSPPTLDAVRRTVVFRLHHCGLYVAEGFRSLKEVVPEARAGLFELAEGRVSELLADLGGAVEGATVPTAESLFALGDLANCVRSIRSELGLKRTS